jgi:hypothetical protein
VIPATIDDETENLLQLFKGDGPAIIQLLDTQLSVLANRSQTLLSLAGITITVTGFSGAAIAGSGALGAILLCAGLALVMMSAAFAIAGILHIDWITKTKPLSVPDAIRFAIRMRDEKTTRYRISIWFLVIGLTLYVSSVALLLLKNLPH